MDRREFGSTAVKVVLAGSLLALAAEGCAVSTPTGPAAFAPLTLDLDDPRYAALKEVGGAVQVPLDGQKPLIVTRVDAMSFAASFSRCTHRGCEVSLPDARGILVCHCHGARFDLRGRVTRGPARVDLPAVDTLRERDTLVIQPAGS